MLREGRKPPFAVIATRQTGGMGRYGRHWKSPAGGLWLTFADHPLPASELSAAPLAVALAVCQALENQHSSLSKLQIKWPNDVYCRGRKLCGILCESSLSGANPHFLAGIGINGDFPLHAIEGGLRAPATTMREELGEQERIDLADLESTLLRTLNSFLSKLRQDGLHPIASAIRERLLPVDPQRELQPGEREVLERLQ